MDTHGVDPLAPLKPVARLAAVGVVALGGVLVAAQLHPAAASAAAASSTAGSSGRLTALGVLSGIAVPPGSSALHAKPSGAPGGGRPPFVSGSVEQQTAALWWSTDMSAANVYAWFRAHPPTGMKLTMWGEAAQQQFLGFTPQHTSRAAGEPTVYVQTFSLAGGRTGIQLSADVSYPPMRTAQEAVPAAAKLVVVPQFGANLTAAQKQQAKQAAGGVTITDPARIADVTAIINSLQPVDGVHSCPADDGSGLRLTFETASGARLAEADADALGCGEVGLTIGSGSRLELDGSGRVVQRIQSAIGTDWNLGFTPPK